MGREKNETKRQGAVPYEKHVYWLTAEEESDLREKLSAESIKLKNAKGVVCTPLDPFNRVSSVAPNVWNDTCRRAGSWYRTSDKHGLYLVVSAFPLEACARRRAAVISASDFSPPRLAREEDKLAMLEDPMLKERMPAAWLNVSPREKQIYLRWARRMGSQVSDFAFLFLSQTANHANFINPRFYIDSEGTKTPYSLDRTAHLCSCCLELFQVLGAEYPRKLVAPCPGAAVFARLKPDRYLLVTSDDADGGRESRR